MNFHDKKVRNIHAKRVQCDEMWSFVYAKERNSEKAKYGMAGDIWTWVAIDTDTKLIISWLIGNRDSFAANWFMDDLKSRLANKVQLTTDGFRPYLEAVENNFGNNIDYAQLVKIYGKSKNKQYEKFVGATKTIIVGNPNEEYISTNAVERQNLTVRTHVKRFTRRTNAHSKKVENHGYATALHFVYYNWCKIHSTLRVTPAMEAGLTKDIIEIEDIVKLANQE
jgi:IS1 family transposase